MKLRIESVNGRWEVFIEDSHSPGRYKKINPESCAYIDVNTRAKEGEAEISIIVYPEAPSMK